MKKQFKFNRAYSVEDMTTGEDPNVISFSLASANPYLREDSHGKKFYEILEISEEAIDFTRLVDNRAPLLFSHDPERQLGAITKAWIENGKLMVTAKFSSNSFPQSILRDIQDGLRKNVSVGYQILDFVMVKENDYEHPVMLVKHWLPLEGSIVSIPADEQVGIGRSLESVDDEMEDKSTEADKTPEEVKACESASSEDKTKECEEDDKDRNADTPEDCKETPAEATPEADEEKACGEEPEEKAVCPECGNDPCTCEEEKKKAAEVAEIRSLSELTNTKELAEKYISENRSLDEFKAAVKELNKEELNVKENIPTMEKFNILKALRGFTSKADANFSESYEFKMIEEAKRNHNALDADIILEPEMFRSLDGSEPLNQTIYRTDLYTGVLRPESVLAKTGATVIPVDGPSISFSVATSGMAGGFVDLNGEIPSADMSFALKQMTPKKCGAYTQIDYKALLQDRPEIEGIVMDDIVKGVDEAIDFAAITGTGENNEPTGIMHAAGVNEIAASGIYTLEGIQEFEEKIRESNDFTENLTWVMCGKDYYKFMRTYLSSVSQNEFLLDPKTRLMLGHPVAICNKLQPGEVILGNFAELFVATFDGLRLKVVEDAQLSRKQAVEVQCFTAADVLVRRPKSFSVSKNA